MSMLLCTALGAGLLGAGCHKTLFVCRQRTGNKVELLVFSSTKGRDSFYRDPRQCQCASHQWRSFL